MTDTTAEKGTSMTDTTIDPDTAAMQRIFDAGGWDWGAGNPTWLTACVRQFKIELADLRAANASMKADAAIVDRMRDRLADLEALEDGGITSVMWDELCALRRWLGDAA